LHQSDDGQCRSLIGQQWRLYWSQEIGLWAAGGNGGGTFGCQPVFRFRFFVEFAITVEGLWHVQSVGDGSSTLKRWPRRRTRPTGRDVVDRGDQTVGCVANPESDLMFEEGGRVGGVRGRGVEPWAVVLRWAFRPMHLADGASLLLECGGVDDPQMAHSRRWTADRVVRSF